MFFFLNFLVFLFSFIFIWMFCHLSFAVVVLLSHHHFFCHCHSAFFSSQLVLFIDTSLSCSPPRHHEAALVITMHHVTLHTCLKFMPHTPVVRMPCLCYAERNHTVDLCSMPHLQFNCQVVVVVVHTCMSHTCKLNINVSFTFTLVLTRVFVAVRAVGLTRLPNTTLHRAFIVTHCL